MKETNENLSDSVRLLNGNYMSIDDYNEMVVEKTQTSSINGIEITPDDLPF
jgi:hypothetical protein